jgi:hypothetical protein
LLSQRGGGRSAGFVGAPTVDAGDGYGGFTRIRQIFVPVAFDLEVGRGAEIDRFDQVVREIGMDAGLPKLCRAPRPPDPPRSARSQVPLRRVDELAGLPHVVAVAADEIRTGVPVRLRMHDQRGLVDLGSQRVVAGERPALPLNTTCVGVSLRMTSTVST